MSYNESLNANSNYPPMSQSEWDSAPFNQEDLPEREFEVAVSYSISKDAKVTTDDYDGGEYDEDGYWCAGDMNNPTEAYENSSKSITEILEFAKKCAEYMLSTKNYEIEDKYSLRELLDSCQGWNVDKFNVEQE